MVPRRGVVAGPDRRVALHTGVASAGDDERPPIRFERLETLECCTRHQRAVLVVILQMGPRMTIAFDLGDVGDGLSTEGCRLVHVVPHAAYTCVDQRAALQSPPLAHRCARDIRQYA